MKYLSLLLVFLISFVYSTDLNDIQKTKLKSNVVFEKDGSYQIQEYNKVNFGKKVLFDGKSIDTIYVATIAKLAKANENISKENFIAISSTISDQMIQSVFFNPQYLEHLVSVELLTSKPNQPINLEVVIDFVDNGLKTAIVSSKNKQEVFIPYGELFIQRLR